MLGLQGIMVEPLMVERQKTVKQQLESHSLFRGHDPRDPNNSTRLQFSKEPPSPPNSAKLESALLIRGVCDEIHYLNCGICYREKAEPAWGRLDNPI